ncbi:MAG: nucleotide exchange factor GrpE [Bryobacterales bacterium]|nr:nucleotide exchange factor GrpE [Bryobacterales bacterium]
MSTDWKSEIMRDFSAWLLDLPSDGEPPVAPPSRRGLSDLFSAVSKLGSEVALQNRASKQAVVGLQATNAELSRMGTSLGAQRKALQALISESGPARQSPRDLAVGFLEIRDSLVRSHEMVAAAEAALKAGNPAEDRMQPVPGAGEHPPTEERAQDNLRDRPPEVGPAPAEVRTQGDVEGKSREDDSVPEEPQVRADVPAEPQSHDGSQHASQEVGPAPAERPEPETEEIAQHREIVADIAGTLALVLRKFDSILMSQGIGAIETVGRPFDPALMSVVGTREVPGVPSWIVVDEVRGGFVMGRRVLRSAEVFVNRRGGE